MITTPHLLPSTPPEITNHTLLVGVLQQLQAALSLEPNKNPTLADVALFVEKAQRDFGSETDLELVIQALVAGDLERQFLERLQRKQSLALECVLASIQVSS